MAHSRLQLSFMAAKAELNDFKVGDEITVTYQEQAQDVSVARRIEKKGVSPSVSVQLAD